MFWTVLLIVFILAIPAFALLGWLGMLIGEWAILVAGALLLAGVVTAFLSAYQKIMNRLDQLEKALSQTQKSENE
ncbi:hypothetical protein [Flintibacter muris]|uniref:hypothetical protein n=1 Tax=Flintibacter muris TaxID=2941327 RepID=UPI00203D9219|nr:hypothetical protein [Flintibacter muris]